MRVLRTIPLLILLVCTCAAQEIKYVEVEQILAVANSQPVLRSDIIWNLALDPKVSNAEIFSKESQEQMLAQLIDQKLLLYEARGIPGIEPSPAEVTRALGDLIARFPSEEFFYDRIAKVGLSSSGLSEIVRNRLRILNLIDFRFRAFVIIPEEEILNYYRQVLMPKLIEQGIKAAENPTQEERDLIDRILTEEQVNRAIESYLENLRQQSDIVFPNR